jgi:hypothetical protein
MGFFQNYFNSELWIAIDSMCRSAFFVKVTYTPCWPVLNQKKVQLQNGGDVI